MVLILSLVCQRKELLTIPTEHNYISTKRTIG